MLFFSILVIYGINFLFVCLFYFFLFISLEVTPSPKEQPPTFPLVSVADEVFQLCLTYSILILRRYFLLGLHLKVGIDKDNLLYRTHKMEAFPVA